MLITANSHVQECLAGSQRRLTGSRSGALLGSLSWLGDTAEWMFMTAAQGALQRPRIGRRG